MSLSLKVFLSFSSHETSYFASYAFSIFFLHRKKLLAGKLGLWRNSNFNSITAHFYYRKKGDNLIAKNSFSQVSVSSELLGEVLICPRKDKMEIIRAEVISHYLFVSSLARDTCGGRLVCDRKPIQLWKLMKFLACVSPVIMCPNIMKYTHCLLIGQLSLSDGKKDLKKMF